MMTPEKIENTNAIAGLTSVDTRIDKDKEKQNRQKQGKKHKKKIVIDPDELLEEALESNRDEGHIDFKA